MTTTGHATPPLDDFRAEARSWIASTGRRRRAVESYEPATGELDVSIFHRLDFAAEAALLKRLMDWQAQKHAAGYGALTWPAEYGGRELPVAYQDAFGEVEAEFELPPGHETFAVTLHLMAPTVRLLGSPEMRAELIPAMLRGEGLCCQLFSEPGAGSDLASLGTRAARTPDGWVVNGQKVWSSGAQFSRWGLLLTRSDPELPKHAGITAFVIPMDLPGVEVRPLRQMTGGTSFNEVFFTDVLVPDAMRIGAVGEGWKVALTTLAFERQTSSLNDDVGGNLEQLLAVARLLGVDDVPAVRRQLAEVHVGNVLNRAAHARDQRLRAGGTPLGAIGSVRKLQWVDRMLQVSEAARRILGDRLVVDSGEWGTFVWGDHVLGVPGYRIAGGSDEIQHNIVAERLLGLPPEPREDKNTAWKDLRR
jgi:alkylation response protein AidB-like acyl-CoA dehydrogenase